MYELGIIPSYSRHRVSNDNPYSESLFRTVKYCPSWPKQWFSNIGEARKWVARFVAWYNNEHRHSQIKFVTPNQRHTGLDLEILKQRKDLYQMKKKENPMRWSGPTRNWEPINLVCLNPEKQKIAAWEKTTTILKNAENQCSRSARICTWIEKNWKLQHEIHDNYIEKHLEWIVSYVVVRSMRYKICCTKPLDVRLHRYGVCKISSRQVEAIIFRDVEPRVSERRIQGWFLLI